MKINKPVKILTLYTLTRSCLGKYFALPCLLLLLNIPLVRAQESQLDFPINHYEKDVVLQADGLRRAVMLPDSLIIAETEQVWVQGQQLTKPEEYQIDYSLGVLYLRDILQAGTEIRVKYHRAPFDLPRTYKHRSILRLPSDTTKTRTVLQQRKKALAQDQGFASELRKSGSIVRGVTVGSNRDLKVDAGLRMQISGKIAENLEVVASLTDQNTPIQPEGNTQTLQEIDKVFVEVKGPGLNVTMGDYYIDYKETEFSRFSRKLQGAMATVELGDVQLNASGAVSRGQFYSQNISGREGYQGP